MLEYPDLLPHALSEMFAEVSTTHKLTRADRYGLLAALLDDSITEEERRALDRILYSLRKGRIQLVDEFSGTN